MLLKSFVVCVLVAGSATCQLLQGNTLPEKSGGITKKANIPDAFGGIPYTEFRTHEANKVALTISNWGSYGFWGGCVYQNGDCPLGCEYPAGSWIEYLYFGALWVGAVVDGDTLVSVGVDGWQHVTEMYPDDYPKGAITEHSRLPSDPICYPSSISDQDLIAVFYDTLTNRNFVIPDPFDGRNHRPLGVKIVQESYAWRTPQYEDFVIFRYRVTNIGNYSLKNVVFGLLFDCDVWDLVSPEYGFADDISGSIVVPDQDSAQEIRIAWSADNDGDPFDGQWSEHDTSSYFWGRRSPRAVFGVSLLDFPLEPDISFNWWVSEGRPDRDWGPRRTEHLRDFGTGGLGTPEGDRNKYHIMSHREIDYPQLWSHSDLTSEGWMPTNPLISADLADGTDTRFLLSFGFVDLSPGDSVTFAFVVSMGENFHRNPNDFDSLFNANNPAAFYNSLDFSDLITNVFAARRLYDSLKVNKVFDPRSGCSISLSDIVILINHLLFGGARPSPAICSDINCDCKLNLLDLLLMIYYYFALDNAALGGCNR